MTKSDLIRKVITERGYESKKGLAQYLVKTYPDIFKDVEATRTHIRILTGAGGKFSRRAYTKPEMTKFFYNGFSKWAEQNLNTETSPWNEPFVIPDSIKILNVIADLHSVHLCKKTMEAFIKNTKDKTAVLINGDLLDSEALSRHLKGHNVIEYEKELEICHQILKGLKEEFTHVYFKAGNHDFWLERYLLNNAREVFKLLGLELSSLLRVGELGVHYIHNLKYIKYGDLDIIHGHEFPGFGGGKFPATTLVDRWQTFKHQYDVKVMASHSHRQDHTLSKRSKDGLFGEGWVTPAMCRKSASYNPYAGWDNGWAELTNEEGRVTVKLILYE
jgi:hypothetical protein